MTNQFSFRVAGISHRQSEAASARVGDPVVLAPEPDNPFDPNAIRVLVQGSHVGYVPREKTALLRAFSAFFESDSARVSAVLGGDEGYLTGLEIAVTRKGIGDDSSGSEASESVELDPRKLRYVVLRRAPLQALLMSILSRQEGKLPFPIRVDGKFVPASTRWERHYRDDGNDMWDFSWRDSAGQHRVRFFLFTDQECEVLFPSEDGLRLDGE
jgi:hypothetical protein